MLLLVPSVSCCFLLSHTVPRLLSTFTTPTESYWHLLYTTAFCRILLSPVVPNYLPLYPTMSAVFCCILPCLMLYSPVSSYIAQSPAVSYSPDVSYCLLIYPSFSCCILLSPAVSYRLLLSPIIFSCILLSPGVSYCLLLTHLFPRSSSLLVLVQFAANPSPVHC